MAASTKPNPPFVRPLYPPGDDRHSKPGPDVLGVKRGLSRAGFMRWHSFTAVYDAEVVHALKEFQQKKGILATGNYGHASHDALRGTKREGHPGEWAFDHVAVEQFEKAEALFSTTPLEQARARFLAAAAYWTIKRDQIDYEEIRPFPIVKPPAIPKKTDCSGYVTDLFYAAGAPDPNGRGYDGQGYTGTLVGNGSFVGSGAHAIQLATIDCLVFYGFTHNPSPAFPYGSPTHVAAYIGGGYVSSNGSDPGPLKLPATYRGDIHSVRRYRLV